MAFRLTKKEQKQKDDFVCDLEIASAALGRAVAAYNEGLQALREGLLAEIATYNEKLEEVREFVEDVASSREEEYGEKSERWQEGDKGTAAATFYEAWQEVDLEAFEPELPEDLEEPDLSHRDDVENLPDAAED